MGARVNRARRDPQDQRGLEDLLEDLDLALQDQRGHPRVNARVPQGIAVRVEGEETLGTVETMERMDKGEGKDSRGLMGIREG